ncbi:hypothetical protein [Propionivibrio soli]|uniref:hypothetical protein n=1 Tax=Propionivibrio soli TaxID=2976531 RepID=UPI0021E85459|nr:hypothetical protein [Propionivibrio soli]
MNSDYEGNLHIFFFLSITAYACGGHDVKEKMARQLMKDDEFTTFVCGDEKQCRDNVEIFTSALNFRERPANKTNSLKICLVESIVKARNGYTGIFIKGESGAITYEFSFFGSGIGPTKRLINGYFTLEGREIIESGVVEKTTFEWNGKHYTSK